MLGGLMVKQLAASAILICLSLGSVFAETLNFASPAAARFSIHSQVLEPWIDKILVDSEGAIDIRTFYSSPLGNYNNMYDRVLDDVVQIAFTTTAQVGGQFVKSDIAAMPSVTVSSLEGSTALWKLYESGLIASEYSEIKLLALIVFPNSALHMTERPIRSLEDFRGAKIRTAGRLQSDILLQLGGSPVTTAPADIYQGLNSGVFDGAIMPWTGVESFRLHEITHYHLEAPLGSSVGMVFMNPDAFSELPLVAQQAIEKNSGLSLTQELASHLDDVAERFRHKVSQHEGQSIEVLDAEEAQNWHNRFQLLINEWSLNTPDGKEVLAAFREQVDIFRNTE